MPDGGTQVLAHLADACGQVVTHGLNALSPGARQAVAAALAEDRGDIEIHVLGLNPLSLVVEFVHRASQQRVLLWRVVPDVAAAPNDLT